MVFKFIFIMGFRLSYGFFFIRFKCIFGLYIFVYIILGVLEFLKFIYGFLGGLKI